MSLRKLQIGYILASLMLPSIAYAQVTTEPLIRKISCVSGAFQEPVFILRQDFTDVPALGCADAGIPRAAAVGSRLSFTADRLAKTESVTVDGLAALDFQYSAYQTELGSFLNGFAFGPYVQGSGTHQFATPAKSAMTSDTLTPGGFTEFDISTGSQLAQGLLRIHGGETTTNLAVQDPNFVVEYVPRFDLPGFNNGAIHFGGPTNGVPNLCEVILAPEVEFQYDRFVSGPRTFPIFSTNTYATRIGPVLNLRVLNFANPALAPLTLALTYHYSVDTSSGRTYSYVQPSVSYNFGANNIFAISASYAYGNSDATGTLQSQLKLALAVKI